MRGGKTRAWPDIVVVCLKGRRWVTHCGDSKWISGVSGAEKDETGVETNNNNNRRENPVCNITFVNHNAFFAFSKITLEMKMASPGHCGPFL